MSSTLIRITSLWQGISSKCQSQTQQQQQQNIKKRENTVTFSPTKDYEHCTTNIDETVGAPSKAASPIDSAVWVIS